jgi:thiol:disulfide interchange protein DsbA
MTAPPPTPPEDLPDEVTAAYRRISALEHAHPGAQARAAILAEAARAARSGQRPRHGNTFGDWKWKAAASIGVIGLVGVLTSQIFHTSLTANKPAPVLASNAPARVAPAPESPQEVAEQPVPEAIHRAPTSSTQRAIVPANPRRQDNLVNASRSVAPSQALSPAAEADSGQNGAAGSAARAAPLAAARAALSPALSPNWAQGIHYFLIQPAHPSSPTAVSLGKVEVTEVFSYACPACDRFYPTVDKLRATLPANAEMTFIPAAFNQAEDWPMFQRAYYAAQALGIEQKTHDALFDAIWKTGELAILDPVTEQLKVPPPSLQDAAHWYAKAADVAAQTFVNAAASVGVENKTREADEFVRSAQVDQTPTLIVNGKYRLTPGSACAGDSRCPDAEQRVINLVLYLVQRESAAESPAAKRSE